MKRQFRSTAMSLFALAVAAALSLSCGARAQRREMADSSGRLLRVGIVLEAGGIGDMSENRSAYEGALQLARQWRGRVDGVVDEQFGDEFTIRVAETPEGSDRRVILRSMAEEGRNLVFAIGFLFSDSLISVARDYPDTRFVLVDGFVPDLTEKSNITCVSYSEHEGAFLMGAAAGLLTLNAGRDVKVGFIGGMDMPIAHRYLAGYMAGAAWTNPELRERGKVMWAFLGRDSAAFANTKQAAFYSSSLIQKAGIRVLFSVSGAAGLGVVETAARYGASVLGADMNQAALYAEDKDPAKRALAPTIVSSMIKRVDSAVLTIGHDAFLGLPVPGGYRNIGIAEGGISWVSTGLPGEYGDILSSLSKRIAAGEIIVPMSEDAASVFISEIR